MQTTPLTREYVATEVRVALVRDGRTASELATDAGINKSSLSRKLRGQVSFTVEELVAIAAVLGIDPGSLIPAASAA